MFFQRYDFFFFFFFKIKCTRQKKLITQNQVIAYLEKARIEGQRVLVHCFAGLSRSVTFTCAYLMKKYGMTFKEAITLVKKSRPNVNPNTGFRKQLIEYEKILYGTTIDENDIECQMNSNAT